MAGRIERIELSKPDVTKDIRDSIELTERKADALVATLVLIKETLSDIKKTASTIKGGVLDLGKTNTKDLDARANAQRTANKLAQDAVKAREIEAKLIRDYEKLEAQRETRLKRLSEAEAKAHAQREKQYNKEIENANKLGAVYLQESHALNEMRNRYKDLAVQREKGVKLTRDERNEMRSLLTQINQTDASLKKIDASVGQNQRNVGNYTKAVSGLRSGLAQLGVSFGVFQIGKFAVGEIVKFESAVASFRTIVSDLNDNEFEKYKNQIKSVATETKRSNTEIAESFEVIAGLNSEFAKTEQGLGDVSEAVSTLSDASRDDLATSASNLVGIMNQFDLSANQANRTINVLAAGQAVGASSITQSAEAYKNFGAVAKGANISLEQSQALIQVLGKNSIFGAEAGTKLRGVTLQLQKAQLGYASGQFNINDALEEFNAKMAKKTTASAKDAYATKIFGAENITAGKIVSNNIELFNRYTESVTGTNEAQKASEINTNTLSKRWEQLKNAISNSITSNSSANSGLNILKGTMKLLADNLDTVIKVVYQGIQAWVLYKTTMASLKLIDQIRNFKDFGSAVKNTTGNLNDAQKSAKGFGQAMSGIGWTAIITTLVEVAKAWYDVASGANLARERAELFEKAISVGNEQATSWLEKRSKIEKGLLQAIELRQSKGEITEKEAIKLRQDVINQTEDLITKEKTRLQAERAILNIQIGLAKSARDRVKSEKNTFYLGNTIAYSKALAEAEFEVTRLIGIEKNRREEIRVLNGGLEGVSDTQHGLNVEMNQASGVIDENKKKTKELNTELKEQNRYLSEQLSLNQQLRNEYSKNRVDYEQGLVDDELMKQVESARGTGEFDNTLTKYKELINQRTDASIDGLKQEYEFRVSELNRTLEEEHKAELKAITEERDEKLKQEGLTKAQRLIIQQQFNDQLKKLDDDKILRQLDNGRRQLLLEEQLKDDKFDVIKQGEQDVIDAKSKTLEAQKEFLDELGTATTEKTKENAKKEIEYIDYITKYLEDSYDRRIAKLNEFVEASRKAQDDLRELANNGNIQAQQSIAREAQLEREATANAQRLERQKQLALSISAFLQSFNNKLLEKNADGTPKYKTLQALAEAGAEKAVVDSFLKAIPAFKDGGVHKDGGLMLVNDAPGSSFREIIETPKGELYSPEGRNVIMNAPAGTKIHTQDQWNDLQNSMRAKDAFRNANSLGGNVAGNSFDIAPLLKEVKGLKKAISDQPDRWSEFMQITQKSFELHFVEKKGNDVRRIIHQYRTKK